jgi:hypothetical protein
MSTKKPETWDNIHWWNKGDGVTFYSQSISCSAFTLAGKYFQNEHPIASYFLPVNEADKMQFVSKIKLGDPFR